MGNLSCNLQQVRYSIAALICLFFIPNIGAVSAKNLSGDSLTIRNTLAAEKIIGKAIERKEKNRLRDQDYYTCERYERLNAGWVDLTPKERNLFFVKPFHKLFANTDSADRIGKPVDFVLSSEMIEDLYYRKSTHTKRNNVKAINRQWVPVVAHEQGVRAIVTEFFSDYNLYDNQMTLLMQSFTSPLSSAFSKTIYNYSFDQMVTIDGVPCYKIDFEPVNKQFLAFKGSVYIAGDSTYAVARAHYMIPNETNLNYINEITFDEEYKKVNDTTWVIVNNEVNAELEVIKLLVRRTNSYKNYRFDPVPDAIFDRAEPIVYEKDATKKTEAFWAEHRHFEVTGAEKRSTAVFSNFMGASGGSGGPSLTSILVGGVFMGYVPATKYFSIGDLYSFWGGNAIEGTRFRFGGTTTVNVSRHLFAEGYGAYGTKDKEWKYSGQLAYSFLPRNDHPNEFPANTLYLNYQHDMIMPGQEFVNLNKDNVFLSWRRSPLDKMILETKAQLTYRREFYNGLSYMVWANHKEWQPRGVLEFRQRDNNNVITDIENLRVSEMGFRFRFAIGERFYQKRTSKMMVSRFTSVFTLTQSFGIKSDALASDYRHRLTELSLEHSTSFGTLGYTQLMFKMGKQWSQVPFPLLIIHQGNPSYLNVPESYNLMGVFEFMSDQYASIDVDYHLNGLLLNWLPVNRYLKLREVANFKGLIGGLSEKNDPTVNKNLKWLLPTDAYKLNGTPYMEAGVGVENILSLLRIDYIWRLTYRDHPNIDKSGLRFSIHFQF